MIRSSSKCIYTIVIYRHVDHIGNLMEVAETFPDAQVAMHILEAPYLAGGVSYGSVGSLTAPVHHGCILCV